MKKHNNLIYAVTAFLVILMGCSRENPVDGLKVPSTLGVYVLCEGTPTQPGDFSFINTKNDSVYNDVYSNSNNGAPLGLYPDGFYPISPAIFICCQGSYQGAGKMFKIDYNTYKVLDTSANFGTNPYEFELEGGNFFITNSGDSTVTEMDMNMNIVTQFPVGPKPSDIKFGFHSLYVAKMNYTTENSVAIIDAASHIVTKANFPAPPVSIAFTVFGMFVSDYSNKKLYVLDTITTNKLIDSIAINVPGAAIGEIIPGDYGKLYIVGFPTLQSYAGNSVYRYDIQSRQLDQSFTINLNSPDDVYGINYDAINKIIYIASSNNNLNGRVLTYNSNGAPLKQYQLGETYPRKFAFKYSQ